MRCERGCAGPIAGTITVSAFVIASSFADGEPGPLQLWRLALDGRIVQHGTDVLSQAPRTAGVIATSDGATIAGAVYGPESNPVLVTRATCP